MSEKFQITVRLSNELWQLIQQAMRNTQHRSVNEFIRTCIRAYIDETADIVGSRMQGVENPLPLLVCRRSGNCGWHKKFARSS